MSKSKYDMAGFISEEELDDILEDHSGAGTPAVTTSSILCAGIIAATYLSGFCPTSACTKSCAK